MNFRAVCKLFCKNNITNKKNQIYIPDFRLFGKSIKIKPHILFGSLKKSSNFAPSFELDTIYIQ